MVTLFGGSFVTYDDRRRYSGPEERVAKGATDKIKR
jgi:hypothetical protein